MRLFDLTLQQLELLRMIEDGLDVGDTLEANEEATEIKVEGYAKIIRILEGDVATHKKEIERLAKNAQTYENAVKRLKKNIYDSMVATGKKKIEGQLFKFSIAKTPQSVNVLDETKIPKKYYIKQDAKLDVKGIGDLLKSGVKIRGVQLKQGESLRIK